MEHDQVQESSHATYLAKRHFIPRGQLDDLCQLIEQLIHLVDVKLLAIQLLPVDLAVQDLSLEDK